MPVHDLQRLVALSEFHDFHIGFVTTLRNTLNRILRPTDYYASAEGRIMGYEPDTSAFQRGLSREASPPSLGGVAIQTSDLSHRLAVDKSQTNKVALESSNHTITIARTESESTHSIENFDKTFSPRRDIPFWK